MNETLDSIICLRPFYALELNIKGDVSVCCPAWSKGMVGNTKKNTLREIWNGTPLRLMREMMLEGRWDKICRSSCPVIMNYRMKQEKISLARSNSHVITEEVLSAVRIRQTVLSAGPTWINLANSPTCNLNCIMCGRENYKENGYLINKELAEVKDLLPGLRELYLTGNGDPFARSDTRELMLNLDKSLYPELKINLLTNGILLPKYWDRIRHLVFGELNISVDAATPRTYETIRRNGSWGDLLKAFELVSSARSHFSAIVINMTVMKDNYREIPAFVELAARYGFTAAINRIRGKWGDQNIFTAADPNIMAELGSIIVAAREKAGELNVPFYSSGFNDILAGESIPFTQRCRQIVMDNLVQLYYRVKP